jgi:hypothetical protein
VFLLRIDTPVENKFAWAMEAFVTLRERNILLPLPGFPTRFVGCPSHTCTLVPIPNAITPILGRNGIKEN